MNVAKLNELIAVVKLEGVRLVETKAMAHVRDASDAGDVCISISRDARVESPPSAGLFLVLASLRASVEDKSTDKPLVDVKATFELAYELPEVFSVPDEDLRAFAETNGVLNVWPYWREFLQNTLQRMALPPIVLPLLTMKQIVSNLAEERTPPGTIEGGAKAAAQ